MKRSAIRGVAALLGGSDPRRAGLARHVDYIHDNPVKHGLVTNPIDRRWSSIHHYARRGIIPPDWGSRDRDGDFGDWAIPDCAALHPGYLLATCLPD
jgi:hypothetical protein